MNTDIVVYIVVSEDHTDCYKRTETLFEILGVFTDEQKACEIALMTEIEECKYYVDDRINEWNKCMDDLMNQSNNWISAFDNFDCDQWYGKPEFTLQSSGVRCEVLEDTVKDGRYPKSLNKFLNDMKE